MNRNLLTVVASGALTLPMAAQLHADEMPVEPHSHPAAYDHTHPLGEDGKETSLHAHEFRGHGHDELHLHDFNVYGHIGRVLVISDGGPGESDVNHADTGPSVSRFGMKGNSDLDGGLSGGFHLEYAAGASGGDNPGIRQANLYLSGAFGKLTLGQQSHATDGIPYSNFDEHAFMGGVEVGCDYCDAAGIDGDFLATYSGGRGEAIRYDTPSLGVGAVSVSGDGDDRWDVSANISGDAGVAGYELKAGYADLNEVRRTMLAGKVGLAQGSHFNAAWGKTDADESDYLHFGLGHNMGETSVAATFTTSDIAGGGNSWAFGIGQGLGSGVEVFASYKRFDYDDMMSSADLFVVGSRVKF